MDLVRDLTISALYHSPNDQNTTPDCGKFCITFRLAWTLQSFFKNNYGDGLWQDLGSSLIITGDSTNAYMSTIRTYLEKTWPSKPFTLLHAIEEALTWYKREKNTGITSHFIYSKNLVVDLANNNLLVTDTEEEIIVFAQQAAWLVIVCDGALNPGQVLDQPRCAISLFELTTDTSNTTSQTFNIASDWSETEPILPAEDSGWQHIVGPRIIATGFSIPERETNMRGLEIPMHVLMNLGGVLKVNVFEKGIILKGRSMAFVPVQRWNNCVQWHIVQLVHPVKGTDKHKCRTLEEVVRLCPLRLRISEHDNCGYVLTEGDLWTTRAFLTGTDETSSTRVSQVHSRLNLIYRDYTKRAHPNKKESELSATNQIMHNSNNGFDATSIPWKIILPEPTQHQIPQRPSHNTGTDADQYVEQKRENRRLGISAPIEYGSPSQTSDADRYVEQNRENRRQGISASNQDVSTSRTSDADKYLEVKRQNRRLTSNPGTRIHQTGTEADKYFEDLRKKRALASQS